MIIPILPLLNVEQCVVISSNNVIHITFAAWNEIFASSFILSEFKPLFHCIPVLQIVTEIGRVFIMLLYPPLNEVEGGYTGFTLSVHPSVSALFSMLFSALYGWDAENWECGNILRVISVLWLKCGYNADISPYSCPNTPIRIFSAFPPYKNAEISPRSCPNTPIRIFSAFPPHFFPHFFHIRMRRFLRVPVRILPSAFSPQGKCGDLGYGLFLVCSTSQLVSRIILD